MIVLRILLSLIAGAHAGSFSVGEPKVTWTKRNVHVCWFHAREKSDFKDEQKKAVQKIISQEYTTERTGISFFGWEDCATLPSDGYDIPLYQDTFLTPSNPTVAQFRGDGWEGSSVVGEGSARQIYAIDPETGEIALKDGYFKRNLQKSSIYMMFNPFMGWSGETATATEELQLTALHEFGHAAGLRHEHVRPESKEDPNCKAMKDPLPAEEMHDTAQTYGDYDPHSIMNYCWLSVLARSGKSLPGFKVGLSVHDLNALKKLYP